MCTDGFSMAERLASNNTKKRSLNRCCSNFGAAQPNILVRTYTRWEESRESGADWAWWWEGETRWFGALVQAKRLTLLADRQLRL